MILQEAQSALHFGEALSGEAHSLATWLCLADTDKLGPARIMALLGRFASPEDILKRGEPELRDIPDMGPKLAEAIVAQAPKLDEYATRATQLLATSTKLGARILTLGDVDYPGILKILVPGRQYFSLSGLELMRLKPQMQSRSSAPDDQSTLPLKLLARLRGGLPKPAGLWLVAWPKGSTLWHI